MSSLLTAIFALAALTLALPLGAQAPASVVRLDPALDAIVDSTAKVEAITPASFGLAEGPLWIHEGTGGYLLFSDIRANKIFKWTPGGAVSLFLDKTGWAGADPPPIPNAGSNGVTLDRQGRLVWVAQGDRAVIRLEKDGKRTVLVDRYQGKRFNRPNDLVVKSDGAIYFTDPSGDAKLKELDFDGVFRFADGRLQLLDQGYRPNGIAFSPDERVLYVNTAGGKTIYRYDVKPDGTVGPRQLFIDMSSDATPGGTDGLKVDQRGNVYSTGPGGLWIMSSDGRHLGTILTPEPIGTLTNVAFGDADDKTLYLTGRTMLARVRANVAGIRPGRMTREGRAQ